MTAPLKRGRPRVGQSILAVALGLLVGGLGTFFLQAYLRAPRWDDNAWVIALVGGGFALVGALLLLAGIHQVLSLRIPETAISLEPRHLRPGESAHLRVRQVGPVRLLSLRANLLCEEATVREVYSQRDGGHRAVRESRIVHDQNVLETGETEVPRGGILDREARITVPEDARPSADGLVEWRIEVWGRVRGWADFHHSFPFRVAPPAGTSRRSRPVSKEGDR